MNEIASIISTVGFPIAMCVLMYWQGEKNNQRYDDNIKSLTETINNNTTVLAELKTILNKEEA